MNTGIMGGSILVSRVGPEYATTFNSAGKFRPQNLISGSLRDCDDTGGGVHHRLSRFLLLRCGN